MANHTQTGKGGERLAAAYLQQRGFSLLAINWRFSYYEIDIIASLENTLHFIEVKTRRSLRFGWPEESVDRRKLERLMTAGEGYLQQHSTWKRIQYDILSITMLKDKTPEYYFIEDVSL